MAERWRWRAAEVLRVGTEGEEGAGEGAEGAEEEEECCGSCGGHGGRRAVGDVDAVARAVRCVDPDEGVISRR